MKKHFWAHDFFHSSDIPYFGKIHIKQKTYKIMYLSYMQNISDQDYTLCNIMRRLSEYWMNNTVFVANLHLKENLKLQSKIYQMAYSVFCTALRSFLLRLH